MSSAQEAFSRAAVAQALYKAVAGQVKTGFAGNVRGAADAALMSMYCEGGATSAQLTVNGSPVGKITMTMSKPHPAVEGDGSAWEEYVWERGDAGDWRVHRRVTIDASMIDPHVLDGIRKKWPRAVSEERDGSGILRSLVDGGDGRAKDPRTGELVPGVRWVPESPKGTTVTGCDPAKVAEALRTPQALADALAPLMLGEGA